MISGCLMLLGWVCASTHAAVYDAVNDFSPTNNPNGVWSYGLELWDGGAFTLYGTNGNDGPIELWEDPSLSYGTVSYNDTTGVVTTAEATWQPRQLAVTPGMFSDFSIVRWTAPGSGIYSITAQFGALHADVVTADVHILLNGLISSLYGISGTPLFNANLFRAVTAASTNLYRRLQAGDTVDFIVGGGGNGTGNYDDTGLAATITQIAAGNADLAVSGAVTPGATVTGSNVIYTVTVTNIGPDLAVDVLLTNRLPPQVEYLAADAGTNGSWNTPQIGMIVASFPLLAAGGSESLTVTGAMRCSTPNRAVLTNTATASSLVNDPVGANNQANVMATNSNPLRKPACNNVITFTELAVDRVLCFRGDGSTTCGTVLGDNLTLSATISLAGVDITQFNANTSFHLTAGNFSLDYTLGDDPHYLTGKTSATFRETEINDDDRRVGSQTVRLKWTAEELTVKVSLKDSDVLNSAATPVLANRYDGRASGVLADAVTASIEFGPAGVSFDGVYAAGAVVSTVVIGRDLIAYPVSAVKFVGAGVN